MKYLLSLIILFTISINAQAQDFPYGELSQAEMKLTNGRLDSNANAMVIKEFGKSSIMLDRTVNSVGFTYVDHVYHVKTKIFNKKGFDKGNVIIRLRDYGSTMDEVVDIRATTVSVVNGAMVRTQLDEKQIFSEKVNKYYSLKKFTMPNLTEGCVIEYTYHVRYRRVENFKSWEFQSDIPKLYSEYVTTIPSIYNYNVSLRGGRKLTSKKAEQDRKCMIIYGVWADCGKMTYVMKDIPALVEEEYMTAANNFRSAIYFELIDYMDGLDKKVNVAKEWKDIDRELMEERTFGEQLKKKDLFSAILPGIIKNTTDNLSKSKAIYAYIAQNIKSDGFIGIYCENTIKKALELKAGNVADINLALVTALNAAGLEADALILSTRENGTINPLFPVITEFNYVIAKLVVDGETYLLDASAPMMPFGMIPLGCINGNGRGIGVKKASYWYDIKAPQKETTKFTVDAVLSSDGVLKGTMSTYSLGYAALNKRRAIKDAGTIADYVEKLDERMTNMKIGKFEIENLDTIDYPIGEKYEFEIKLFNNSNVTKLFYNPYFIYRIDTNPFKLDERLYPVDMGVPRDTRVNMTIRMPENFAFSEPPKNTSLSLPENGGRFVSNMDLKDNTLTFSQIFQLTKPIYSPEEYLSLKEFYSRIIQIQKTDAVFKTN
ncbi:MAG: DUF3857 domain-containing protein [Bacteroidota bacterium]